MKMLHKITIVFLLVLIIIFIPKNINAESNIDVYIFYGDGCPHCAAEIEALEEMKNEYPITIHRYEVYYDDENQDLLRKFFDYLDLSRTGVPYTVIGSKSLLGYSESTTKVQIEEILDFYIENETEYEDVVQKVINGEELEGLIIVNIGDDSNEENEVNLPIFGKLSTKDVSLPVITILMGFIDGFNPCAMWVLLFLISMLIGMEDRKKMWILGFVFISVSALTYFIFMAAWLNLIIFLGVMVWVRLLIGLLGLTGGIFNVRAYIKNEGDGCKVVKKEKRSEIFKKIKTIIHEKNLFLAVIGISVLAISVNIIELFCSLGLPVVYTELLSFNDLSITSYYGYLLLYTLFFMIDDIFVFFIAMTTLKVTGVSTKYQKYSHLIGGILMIVIGLILILKPELLMFG